MRCDISTFTEPECLEHDLSDPDCGRFLQSRPYGDQGCPVGRCGQLECMFSRHRFCAPALIPCTDVGLAAGHAAPVVACEGRVWPLGRVGSRYASLATGALAMLDLIKKIVNLLKENHSKSKNGE